MISIRPPARLDYQKSSKYVIFFGGTIDMGVAENWQIRLENDLSDYDDDLVLCIPRRLDWDASLAQDPAPGTVFNQQVNWELDFQEDSSLNVYYFADESVSPITLLELGSFGSGFPDSTIVRCSSAYFRHGNVVIFCRRHNITLVETYEQFLEAIRNRIDKEFFHG